MQTKGYSKSNFLLTEKKKIKLKKGKRYYSKTNPGHCIPSSILYCGYPKAIAQLHRKNIKANHKWLQHLMRELNIQGRIKRRCVTTTNVKYNKPIYTNLIKDKAVTSINQIWCSDITYTRILLSFVHLIAIHDFYFFIVVGYVVGRILKPKLILEMIRELKMAIAAGILRT